MHQEKNIEDRQNGLTSIILGHNDEYLTDFACTNHSRKSLARMNLMKRRGLFQIPKTHAQLLRINWNKTTFQSHTFVRIPVNLSSLYKKKKNCRKSPKGSRIPS